MSRPRLAGAWVRWRSTAAAPAVAVATVIVAVIATNHVGLPLRDPDHVAALYLGLVGLGVLGMIGLDVLLRARAQEQHFPPSRAAMVAIRRDRWTARRGLAAGAALVGFYLTYMAYRNLKSIVPLLRPGDLFDRQLAAFDRGLFAGNDPATLLHSWVGSAPLTHLLSGFYVAFIVFLPLTIGVALVFARDLRAGLFYTTAQSLNWVLGAASYFVLPALGPVYAFPSLFSSLPASEVTRLQGVLLDQRLDFLADPGGQTPQSIAAFASLHISMSFTALAAAHLFGAGRRLKLALLVWFCVTLLGTVYLGWHYVVDDLAGVLLGVCALAMARAMTGIDPAEVRGAPVVERVGAQEKQLPSGAALAMGDGPRGWTPDDG